MNYPENFVSYRSSVLNASKVAVALENCKVAAQSDLVGIDRLDNETRQYLLQLQAKLIEGDGCFDKSQYIQALTCYQEALKLVLALINHDFEDANPPKVVVTDPKMDLTQIGADLLGNMIPPLATKPIVIGPSSPPRPEEFGFSHYTALFTKSTVIQDASRFSAIGMAAVKQGKWEIADKAFGKALTKIEQDQKANKAGAKAKILLNIGAVKIQRGNVKEAQSALSQSRKLFKDLGDLVGEAQSLHNLGLAQVREGNGEEALSLLNEARSIATRANMRIFLEGESPRFLDAAPNRGDFSLISTESILKSKSIQRIDVDQLTTKLGEKDLNLTFRDLWDDKGSIMETLETPAQTSQNKFTRYLNINSGVKAATISWHGNVGPKGSDLRKFYRTYVSVKDPRYVGFRITSIEELAARLQQLYSVVLPIKIGDCYRYLSDFMDAEGNYQSAASAEGLINMELEAPDLWRRIAENILAWGDSLYRNDDPIGAMNIYAKVVTEFDAVPDSFMYTTNTLAPTGTKVKLWLDAIRNGESLPDLNPALSCLIQTIRNRWGFFKNGLDFFGNMMDLVPPFTFKYLQQSATYFANQADTAEQRYIAFMDHYENEKMTADQLKQAKELADKERDLAKAQETECDRMVESADASLTLAETRRTGAEDMLNVFNNNAYESAALAGLIARGSAFTDDMPTLTYTIGNTTYSGQKHEVLQAMARRQTEISQEMQREQLQNTLNEANDTKPVVEKQKEVAEARRDAARIQTSIAETRQTHAQDMIDSFDKDIFGPEQWKQMAAFMLAISQTALDRAIGLSKLMQRAYNFENMETVDCIRNDYKPSETKGMLGAALLLSDIESFTFRQVMTTKAKPIPIKWPVSLAENYPALFELKFKKNGHMDFNILLDELIMTFPGTYRQQLAAVEIEFEGFLPPDGVHGRLTNTGMSRFRDFDGQSQFRLQPVETVILSRYSRRQDGFMIEQPTELRGIFEGSGVASGWTLDVPAVANDLDFNNIFDVRIIFYFEALFNRKLFDSDSKIPAAINLKRTRAISLRFVAPDAFYTLREKGKSIITLDARDFPYNQLNPRITAIAIAAVPTKGQVLTGTGIIFSFTGLTAPIYLTFDGNNAIQRSNIVITGKPSVFGTYSIEIKPTDVPRKEQLADLMIVLDYEYDAP